MKNLVKLLLLVVFSVNVVYAVDGSKIFDIKEQIFDDLDGGKIKTYKVKNALIKLKLEYRDGGFYNSSTKGNSFIYIKPDKKTTNWMLDEDIWVLGKINEARTIKFYSLNNKLFTITIKGSYLYVNDFKYLIKERSQFGIKVVKLNNIIKIYIDNVKIYATDTKFTKLVKIEQTLFAQNKEGGSDDIHNLKIWELN